MEGIRLHFGLYSVILTRLELVVAPSYDRRVPDITLHRRAHNVHHHLRRHHHHFLVHILKMISTIYLIWKD